MMESKTRDARVYKSGKKKGLPVYCQCGGKILYSWDFSRWFSYCDTCSPVQKINLAKLKKPTGATQPQESE